MTRRPAHWVLSLKSVSVIGMPRYIAEVPRLALQSDVIAARASEQARKNPDCSECFRKCRSEATARRVLPTPTGPDNTASPCGPCAHACTLCSMSRRGTRSRSSDGHSVS